MILNLARYAEEKLRRLVTAGRVLGLPSQWLTEAYCGFVPITDQTPKPACKTPSEMDAMRLRRDALPLHSPLRGPMNKALYSERHKILSMKGKTK